MRDQARKMNVQSLAANKDMNATSVEIRIAKASFTIFFLFLMAWTPYGVVAMIGAFGNKYDLILMKFNYSFNDEIFLTDNF